VVAIDRHEESVLDQRKRTLILIILGGIALLVVRLFTLQVVHHEYYAKLSFSNQLQRERIVAPRGLIRARDGSKLVVNMPVYQIDVLPLRAVRKRELVSLACRWLNLDGTKLLVDLDAWIKRYPDGREMTVVQAANKDQISVLRENSELLSFFRLTLEPRRYFPAGMCAAHVCGYVGEITDAELDARSDLEQGDILGRTGIEYVYDSYLRGTDGIRIVGVSADGVPIGEVTALMDVDELERLGGARPAVPGDDVYLTIDMNLQRAAEAAFQWERGSLVVMDPRNGEILAAVSRPTYDPNMFIGGVSDELWRSLFEDPANPLFNRTVQAAYPPGSIFKLVTAYAALANGIATERSYQKPCYGGIQFGNRYFRCWKREGHGLLPLTDAIIQSCDTYFYQLGEQLDVDDLSKAGTFLGLGKKTGIDLPSEVSGVLPDHAYLDRRYGKGKWSRGLLLNYAIGQGEILVTPLQLCELAATIGAGGRHVHPHIVQRIVDPEGKTVFSASTVSGPLDGVDGNALQSIRRAMEGVVADEHGTGRASAVFGVSVAGKTGTAQNPHGKDHALFVAYAPADAPTVCCAIVMENAGHGGTFAAPVARQVLSAYFYPINTAERPVVAAAPTGD
jgi:penicillin-binding protein 2